MAEQPARSHVDRAEEANDAGEMRRLPVPVEPAHLATSSFALRVAVAVLVAVVILLVTAFLWLSIHVLLDAFAGVLFGIFLLTLSDWVSRYTRLRHGYALAVVLVGLFLIAGGFGWFLENQLLAQARQMAQKLPASLDRLRDSVDNTFWGSYVLNHVDSTTSAHLLQQLSGFIGTVTDFLVAIIVIFFVGLFGAATPGVYRTGLLNLVPPGQRQRAVDALDAIIFNLRWWLAGQVFLMVVIGVTTGVGLSLLGIPLALSLGLIAGILEIIPYVGAWMAAVPAAMIALLIGPWHLIAVLGLYLAIHILEGYLVGPLVQRRAVHLPPALTVLAQLLLGTLLGLMGIFVAAPLTVTAIIAIKMLYIRDTLGDTSLSVPGAPQPVDGVGPR
jgi:predicted PurR-regulated permease PerM